MVLLHSGEVFTFGNNNHGQLGQGHTKPWYVCPSVCLCALMCMHVCVYVLCITLHVHVRVVCVITMLALNTHTVQDTYSSIYIITVVIHPK